MKPPQRLEPSGGVDDREGVDMHNPSALSGRCTAQRPNGQFCDLPSAEGMPFPICTAHAIKVAAAMQERVADIGRTLRQREHPDGQREVRLAEQAQVYYVGIGEHIKIGHTTNIRARMTQLRVDVSAVLATEPGDQRLEAMRHKQFADLRIGRREDFRPEPALLSHIDMLREHYGDPLITRHVKAA